MLKLLFRSTLTALGVGLLVAPSALEAQLRDVVSKEVAVGRSEAALRLEFSDDGTLEIVFEDGVVLIDGDVVGMFEPGDDLEAAWRSLIGQAVSLDDGELAIMLSDWSVPAELAGELADLAQKVDRALEDALSSFDVTVSSSATRVPVTITGVPGSLLSLFLNATSELGLLQEALAGLRGEFAIHVDEDVVVPAGTTVDGTLVVIQGDVRIGGEVDGDVIVVDGTLELLEESRVRGEVRLADARLVRNLGTVEDGLVDLLDEERDLETEIRNRIREEVQEEFRGQLRRELRDAARFEFSDDGGFSVMAPFRAVFGGLRELFKNLMSIFVLGLLGAGAVAFAGTNVDTIAETARRSPGRSAMVGLAGTLLLIPVWLLGTVALFVSIIGIPVAVAWLPLFPLAACAAGVMGYVVVARNTGEWLADSEYPWTGWIRKSNPIYTIFGGLFGLMFAFMAANVISIAPFLGFLAGLLAFVGSVITFFAIQIGFGAVLLTRAGRRREWSSAYDADAAWEAAMEVDVEVDVDATADQMAEGSDDA